MMMSQNATIQDKLETRKNAYPDLPEAEAWMRAYHDLHESHDLVGLFTITRDDGKRKSYYAYGFSPAEKKHFTYVQTNFGDSQDIYLSEYFLFRDDILKALRDDPTLNMFRDDMQKGLDEAIKQVVIRWFYVYVDRARECTEDRLDKSSDVYPEAYAYNLSELIRKIGTIIDTFDLKDIFYTYDNYTELYRHVLIYQEKSIVVLDIYKNDLRERVQEY